MQVTESTAWQFERAPGVVQRLPEAPGFLGLLRPQNASPESLYVWFFLHISDKFAAISVDECYKMIFRAQSFCLDRPVYMCTGA